MHHLDRFLNMEFDGILLFLILNRSGVTAFNDANTDGDMENKPAQHSEAASIDGTDVNWNQILTEYETALIKTVQV